ncbi:MAG TPA: redoxin domain-containing protein, partial [Pilimelia sp.]|nr:redoxin domain-containing protein [Pilimelia sp.]
MVRVGRALAAIVIGTLAAGCGAADESGSTAKDLPATPGPPVSAPGPSVAASPSAGSPSPRAAGVPQALRFSATTVDGAPFDAASLAGKPVVFWFWAAWCPRCRAAADDVARVHRDFAGRVTVVGVAGLNSGDEA